MSERLGVTTYDDVAFAKREALKQLRCEVQKWIDYEVGSDAERIAWRMIERDLSDEILRNGGFV